MRLAKMHFKEKEHNFKNDSDQIQDELAELRAVHRADKLDHEATA